MRVFVGAIGGCPLRVPACRAAARKFSTTDLSRRTNWPWRRRSWSDPSLVGMLRVARRGAGSHGICPTSGRSLPICLEVFAARVARKTIIIVMP